MEKDIREIRDAIRDIPNFPKPGIVFKDITPLLANGRLFKRTIDLFAERYRSQSVDVVLGIESRGFIIGAALAYALGIGFSIVRKPGKLPYKTHSATYELEYGTDTLEVHRDAIAAGARVLIVDDLIATGGTAAATAALAAKLGAEVVEGAFVIELAFLKGREKFKPDKIFSLLQYDVE
ncbi:MAG: adenine phosphoribosyltransferase [Candidatus Binatia bacterium]